MTEQTITEVHSRTQVQFKIRIVIPLGNFSLAMMQREIFQIEPLLAEGSDNDSLYHRVIMYHDTKTFLKISFCVKVGIYGELTVCQR